MNICVFCSSAENLPSAYTQAAASLGCTLAEHGHNLVFGGFETGLMGVVARSASASGARTLGAIVGKRGELAGRPVFACDELFEASCLAQRKTWMEDVADAFVVLPGSFGTLDEFYNVLSEQKMLGGIKPVVVLNTCGFWDALAALDARMVQDGLMEPWCCELYHVVATPEEAIAYVETTHADKSRTCSGTEEVRTDAGSHSAC